MDEYQPIDNAICMEVFKSQENLGCIELGLAQWELFTLDMQHKITTADIFHHKVYTRLGLEARMQTEQERVPFTGGGEENSLFGACTEREGVNRGNYNKGTVTHLSTSSLSMINSFFNTLIAYKLFVFFSSASMTFPKLPFPKTAKKLKSSSPFRRS